MKINTRTDTLTGSALDWAVAFCQNPRNVRLVPEEFVFFHTDRYHYSINWGMGGPIMEKENICAKPHISQRDGKHFYACKWNEAGDIGEYPSIGSTQLIAAMRCYVNSKLGATVDIPEELL